MLFVSNGPVRLATESFGSPSDPALLLIMGANASMLGWPDELCEVLANEGLHVVRFDHRDTGRSTTAPPGQGTYSVEDMASDVLAIMDAYDLPVASLAGMSLGAYIAQIIALQRPDRVATLTLIGAEPLGWDGPALPHISEAFLRHFEGLAQLDWTDRRQVTEFLIEIERLSAGSPRNFDEARIRARIGQILDRTDSPASLFNHSTVTTTGDWTGAFRRIDLPVLIIHGEEDPILPVENGLALATGITGAGSLMLPGVGHGLPTRVLNAVGTRIARHVKGGRAGRDH